MGDNNNSTTGTSIRTIIHSTSGASIKIHPYGATVLSYVAGGSCSSNNTNNNLREQLFVSKNAVLDGTKPIRGGIPLVFPIFGPPVQQSTSTSILNNDDTIVNTMPQHGFARRSVWTIIKEYDTIDHAGIVLELKCTKNTIGTTNIIPTDAIGIGNGWYDGLYECILNYTITFTAKQMTNTLSIHNISNDVILPCQVLFHTYYRIDNANALNNAVCYVKGLDGYTVSEDKVTGPTNSMIGVPIENTDPPVTISNEVDRVYSPVLTSSTTTQDNTDTKVITIGVGSSTAESTSTNTTVQVQCYGSITSNNDSSSSVGTTTSTTSTTTSCPVSYVIWNPYKDKALAMSDFDNDEYNDMICVEPGLLAPVLQIQPNCIASLTQTIHVL